MFLDGNASPTMGLSRRRCFHKIGIETPLLHGMGKALFGLGEGFGGDSIAIEHPVHFFVILRCCLADEVIETP